MMPEFGSLCRGDSHVWVYYVNPLVVRIYEDGVRRSSHPTWNPIVPPNQKCQCGMYRYAEYKEMVK